MIKILVPLLFRPSCILVVNYHQLEKNVQIKSIKEWIFNNIIWKPKGPELEEKKNRTWEASTQRMFPMRLVGSEALV